mmetsp:Transcript_28680/g.39355  ORF Transcript_28680/g.39355 Transcript_28680/m.39355 type:complete len:724 (+) Transcript_28680:94-2265(+)
MWGSTSNGKCGLGPIVNREECFASVPTRVMVGAEDRRIKKLSCGAMHSAIITEAGQLYLFGCGDGGRLGLGEGRYDTLFTPTPVSSIPGLNGEKIATVSCGNSTTILATEIIREVGASEEDVQKQRHLAGGRVFVAGSRNVLGKQCDSFTQLTEFRSGSNGSESIAAVPIKQVSAGYMHSVLVSAEGELFCFGHNKGGCCGLPTPQLFVEHPTSVRFLYSSPTNIGLGRKAYQSTTFNQRNASFAVNGRIEGNGVNKSSCTQQESQPWLEVDLGRTAVIESVIVWNRTDIPQDKNLPRDHYTSRLFPFWVMIGKDPFQQIANAVSLKENLRSAVCKARFADDKRASTWRCPAQSQGRYVRIQLEGYNSLSIAEIEIYGYWGLTKGVGRVSYATAGRDVTVAVVRPNNDPKDLESFYKRATYSDAMNADILRQLESFTAEYDKFGRGEVLQEAARKKACCICGRGNLQDLCEACILYNSYSQPIAAMPPAVGGRRRRLRSISDFLLLSNKPDLDPIVVPQVKRPSKWEVRKKNFLEMLKVTNLFRVKRTGYVSPKEALSADPAAIMETLKYVDHIDEKKMETLMNDRTGGGSVAGSSLGLGDASLAGVLNSTSGPAAVTERKGKNMKMAEETDDGQSVIPESIGDSVVPLERQQKRHGYGPNEPLKEGDLLPTGHVVKPAFPKSIVQQIEESDEFKEMRKEQRKMLRKANRRDKKGAKVAVTAT